MADPLLFRPFQLRSLEVRNRLWVAPMCQYSALHADGMPTDWHLVHLGSLARGGAGLVTIEATAVTPQGRISPHDLGLWSDEHISAFARLAAMVHSHGARVSVQLAHAGRKASTYPSLPGAPTGSVPQSKGGWETVAPSALAFGDYAVPRALSERDIAAIVSAFVAAAGRAVQAGVDVIEVHAAHGYLLHEFLSPLSNTRTDAYGGSLENRARCVREVVRAIRAAHPTLPIMVRISATDWVADGFSVDEAAAVSEWCAADGADLIDVSSGGNVPDAEIPVGPGYQVALAARIREGSLPVSTVGLITSAVQAESILATGQADVVSLGRALLRDPHTPLRWAHELRHDSASALVPPQYHRARF